MSGSTALEIFLLFDFFVIGMVATVAIRHGRAHFHPEKHSAEHHLATTAKDQLPRAMREQLLEAAQSHFQTVLDRAAANLQKDLGDTASRLNRQLEKLGTEAISKEMARYHAELDRLHKATESTTQEAKTDMNKYQAELKAKLSEDLATEKQRLVQQIDTKLADAVTSFLFETLQHNVDLGAQSAYLTSVLEEHKADFAKEVSDETEA